MIKFVICTRHRVPGYGRVEEYSTYIGNDGGERVVTDNCNWRKAIFVSKEHADEIVSSSLNGVYAQMVMVKGDDNG